MGRTTGIEWTDATWNPIRGCSRVSEGCRNCYAEGVAARFSGPGRAYAGLAAFRMIGAGTPQECVEPHWTGEVRFVPERLEDPIRWIAPRKIFVNSMSDLFHPAVKDDWLADIFEVMARAPQHTYQILTKRPEAMFVALAAGNLPRVRDLFEKQFGQSRPPINWWFGVSIEDQQTANERLPILARCSAAFKFVSYEPALGPIRWEEALPLQHQRCAINWIICGGESGPAARPMHPDWVRAARLFCKDYQIPFFFKQWGEWAPFRFVKKSGRIIDFGVPVAKLWRLGKHTAGARLDGIEYKEFPEVIS